MSYHGQCILNLNTFVWVTIIMFVDNLTLIPHNFDFFSSNNKNKIKILVKL